MSCIHSVSLENVVADVAELDKGIAATRSELEAARGCQASVSVLEDFLSSAEDRMDTLNANCKKAQVCDSVILVIGYYCIWSSSFHCHLLSLASVKSRLVLLF